MADKPRFHEHVLRNRIGRPRQVALLSGPRRVGKTTPCRALASSYLNWDDNDDRRLILRGPAAVAAHLGPARLREPNAIVVFDNLRSYRKWKHFLRGFCATSGPRLRLIVTGGAALDIASERRNGLAGRCFNLRMHPWSVGECVRVVPAGSPVQPPASICDTDWNALMEHGGFPEPFLKRDPRFTRRWHASRRQQLFASDLRELATLRDPAAVQMLALLLAERSSARLVYSDFSRELGVAVDTIRRWVELLVRLQYGFCVRPWFTNVVQALRKEPKWFLRDWSGIGEPAARTRTFIACHLLKAVEGWTDLGLGQFELRYVRDKRKREVDFLVVRDRKPWFLVEVGNGDRLDDALGYFQARTRARHAFQVVLDGSFVDADCFARTDPTVVPARTLLSQLL
ncbi:MAG: ATP-binding protein [Steroidobacteraceae bacterium]